MVEVPEFCCPIVGRVTDGCAETEVVAMEGKDGAKRLFGGSTDAVLAFERNEPPDDRLWTISRTGDTSAL